MAKPREIIREEIPAGARRAVFAGGCFWCLESGFEAIEGVLGAISGYAGGEEFDPTYEQVYTNATGHREAVLVYYDENKIDYGRLLEVFWSNIDPTDGGGQFFDRGSSYTTAIFYMNGEQQAAAEASKRETQAHFKKPLATAVLPYTTFYEAEEYHQSFYKKSPGRYQDYVNASGREDYKRRVWQAILRDRDR
ncbi:MAG: peptide-methionine (S)-S-oxide reductase MsrA [Gemmatimonadetes bacterium]|nr:peptide-methionine (S)-S-oxide reductase MsrA [Gemmatimonadota bacterium]